MIAIGASFSMFIALMSILSKSLIEHFGHILFLYFERKIQFIKSLVAIFSVA